MIHGLTLTYKCKRSSATKANHFVLSVLYFLKLEKNECRSLLLFLCSDFGHIDLKMDIDLVMLGGEVETNKELLKF